MYVYEREGGRARSGRSARVEVGRWEEAKKREKKEWW
jgi:hypothetical protein